MKVLNIDVETRSSVNIDAGHAKYFESPDFTILLISYKIDGGETLCIDLANYEEIPDEFIEALFDPKVIKRAFNATFEIGAFERYFNCKLDVSQWECTMILASMCGYPLSLKSVAKALNLEIQKDASGTRLINKFTIPGNKNFCTAQDDSVDWQQFKAYNMRDVDVEYAICQKLSYFKISNFERKLWLLDNKINRQGVLISMTHVRRAIELDNENKTRLMAEAVELTGLSNPNSDKQLKEWMTMRTGDACTSLTKESVKTYLQLYENDFIVKRVLLIKQELARTSISKYHKMIECMLDDCKIYWLHQLYGATKTGRWAGRLLQTQNLTHTKLEGVDEDKMFSALNQARIDLLECDLDELQMMYGNISNFLSSLIRTMIIAPKEKILLISDFAAIEARITAWLAGEKWRMNLFTNEPKADIYKASASQMFNIPLDKITKADRSKGKVAELALGYQGGVGAMIRMGSAKMGLKDEELMPIVKAWRKANSRIALMWENVQEDAMACINEPGLLIKGNKGITYQYRNGTMWITLPSGRAIAYVGARLHLNSRGMWVIRYMGIDQKTTQWSEQETYGGKLVENIVQGIARDVLADSMLRLNDAGKTINMHVHDEVVVESVCDEGASELNEVNHIMSQEIPWAKGLPLKTASFLSPFYLKD